MKIFVFSVFDKAVGAYLQPFFARSKGEAIRSFADACSEPDKPFSKHYLDYVMVSLGEFDDQSGTFFTVDPERVIAASECRVDPAEPARTLDMGRQT